MRTGPPLEGIKVVDVATLGAGPWMATRLADFGADVLKIEHPESGDPLREIGWYDGEVPLWWKVDARNKRCMTLDLKSDAGRDILLELIADADVLVENFRPGTLERWGLGYDVLSARNPRLILLRVTGYGQDGPYAHRPGFGTLAEAMSGWAHLNGFPENPPTLPPMALGDSVTSVLGAFAVMTALYERDAQGGGVGQVIDISIVESLFSLIGQQVTLYDRLGVIPKRVGNRFPFVTPRNVYRCSDDHYVALAASTPAIYERTMRAIGRPDLIEDARFADNLTRLDHADEMEQIVADWMIEHTQAEVIELFEREGAGIAPVYDIAQIVDDPHFAHREMIVTVDDDQLGPMKAPNVVPRFSRTPGRIRHLGPKSGAHTDDVLRELGYDEERIAALHEEGVV
ncbi:MAG: CoA transferase [Actinobacteria bacterium]|nr:CoA transferase [Actinomycetota bacterium]